MKQWKSNGMLLLAAMIWGCAFVAQSVSMDFIGPWTFTCIRSFIGGFTLLAAMPLLDRVRSASSSKRSDWKSGDLWLGGILCGIVLGTASIAQQIGIQYTSVGKAGFITSMYVVLVPIISVFLGHMAKTRIWFCAALSAAGLYFLSMQSGFVFAIGDLWIIVCAFLFSIHILVIGHFSDCVDGIRMSCIQFFTAGAVCMIPMLTLEHPVLSDIYSAAVPILYAGICSSGMGYTLQIVGQKGADPMIAGMLLSLESVFSVLAGFVILGQRLSVRELFGCTLMFTAVILSQLPERKKSTAAETTVQ
ncbi:MAG: DMT family transporter [Erysipelotrichia bacterium]|nr:DMT family transporter [Erysipelotrichia bacterium]